MDPLRFLVYWVSGLEPSIRCIQKVDAQDIQSAQDDYIDVSTGLEQTVKGMPPRVQQQVVESTLWNPKTYNACSHYRINGLDFLPFSFVCRFVSDFSLAVEELNTQTKVFLCQYPVR